MARFRVLASGATIVDCLRGMEGRVDPAEYRSLALRAHELLGDVPLHDVWCVDLPDGGPGRTLAELRELLAAERLAGVNPAVRLLFGIRTALGRVFGWDRRGGGVALEGGLQGSYRSRLSEDDVARSLRPPGSPDGPFQILYAHPMEAVSEIRNRTVHAFSVLALRPRADGYRLYWAVYVAPVGRLTALYMALIDPFRRWIVYPAILAYVRRRWLESCPAAA